VQVEGQGVLEGLAGILAEQLGVPAGIALAADEALLEMPAPLIHLAVDLRTQLLAQDAIELVISSYQMGDCGKGMRRELLD
jgi:hypothetical protein